MVKLLFIFLLFSFTTFAFADQKLEEEMADFQARYGFDKKDYIKYSKDFNSTEVFYAAMLADEFHQPVDSIFMFIKDYKKLYPQEMKENDNVVYDSLIETLILVREIRLPFQEIIKMSETGNPKMLKDLAKKYNVSEELIWEFHQNVR